MNFLSGSFRQNPDMCGGPPAAPVLGHGVLQLSQQWGYDEELLETRDLEVRDAVPEGVPRIHQTLLIETMLSGRKCGRKNGR